MDVFNNYSTNKNANIDLSNLSNIGKNAIKAIAGGGGPVGNVTSVNNVDPINGNITLTTDDIPVGNTNKYVNNSSLNDLSDVTFENPQFFAQVLFYDNLGYNPPQFVNRTLTTSFVIEPPLVADPPNKYFTNQRVTDYLLNLITNKGILYNNNGNLDSLLGATGTYIRSGTNQVPSFEQVRMNEVRDHSTMVREETINIPANGFTNMLDWIQNSNIFNEMIFPNNLPVNPFFWGVRGTADYGMWKIQNMSNAAITIDRVNLIPSSVFIIFQFIRTLILNIMDDNLNDGTVRVRINGINSRQTGGTCQIFNNEGDDDFQLGKTRTLTQGAGIQMTQNADTITISGDFSNINLNDLSGVVITNPTNLQVLKYNGTDWINEQVFLSDISDVTITTPTNGDVLVYNNTGFENRQLNLSEISTGLTTNGDILYHNGTTVTRLPRGTNNQVLTATNTTIQWSDTVAPTNTLATLTDVTITAVANNQFLRYSTGSNKWTNQTITTDDIPATLTNPYCTSTTIQTRLSEIMTTNGDLLIRNGAGNIVRLAIGAANTFLRVNGGLPSWQTITSSDIDTALKSILTTNEDILIRRNGNITRLPVAVNTGDILKYNGVTGEIEWGANNPQQTSLSNLADVQILNDPIRAKSFLGYNTTDSQLGNFWEDVIVEIADINGLQTALDAKLNNNFNAYGQLLIGAGGSAYQTFSKGNNNDFLQVQGGFLEWNPITIAKVTDLQTTLDGKLNTNVLTTAGDILYHNGTNTTRLARGTPGQILRVNGGGTNIGWENQVVVRNYLSELLDCSIATLVNNQALVYNSTSEKWENNTLNTSFITENTNLYYTDTRVDTRLNSKYSAKGRIQVGTGTNTYAEQAAPGADNLLPFSEITNVLNTTGILWRQCTLNDISTVTINTPVNGNALIFNGLNWVNSTAVTTNTANIATVSGRVDTLEANVFIQTIDPAVTPSTLTFNQLNTPVIKANYIANAAIIPVNALLQPALNDANFIITDTPYTLNGANLGGVFTGSATFSQLATRLLQNGPNFSTAALNNVDFCQPGGGTPRINLNYTNNPITPGAYTCYASSGGFLSPNVTIWWGLKNQALVAAQMTTFGVLPVAGADWDQIAIFNGNLNNGGVGVKINVNTVNTYFLIALTTNGGRISSHGIAATQTINENYQFGNQMTFSNSTGDFVISKNSTLQNSENWKINLSALSSYYVQTIVNKVIRTIGQINLNNTVFEDYRMRINNIFSTWSIQSNAGTNYFIVDTANDKVTIPRNTYFQAYVNDNAIATTLPANNQVTTLNLGGNLVQTSGSIAPVLATFNGLASTFTILRAGVYKVSFNAVYLPDNSSDNCEMFLNSNVGTYPAAWKRNRAIDGQYTQVTIDFIHTFGANDTMFVAFRCAQNAPWTVNITSWSINITNLLVS